MGSKKKGNSFILIFEYLFIFIFFFILGEVYFRFVAPEKVWTPEKLQAESWQLDPAIFAQHVFPQKEQNFVDKQWAKKGKGYLKRYINDNGYRGNDFEIKKPAEITRIMIYGGSFVFDIFASLQEDWPHQIEAFLREDGFTNIEVINAGIPGHRSSDSLGRLFTEGHHFSPDIVILCNTFNDIKFFDSDKPFIREVIPYSPKNNPMTNYNNNVERLLCEYSNFYTFIRQEYFQRRYNVGLEGARRGHKRNYYEANKISKHALRQFQLNVELFIDAARNIGAQPIVLTQPRLITAGNEASEKLKLNNFSQMFKNHHYVVDCLTEADRIIRAVVQHKKALLIDASKKFTGDSNMFVDHVHLSEQGSKQLARFIANEIAVQILSGKAIDKDK